MYRILSRPLGHTLRRKPGIHAIQQRECVNFALGIVGILFASLGVKVIIHNKVREGNARLFTDLTKLSERIDILQNRTGKQTFDEKLRKVLEQGYDQTDLGVLGVFTSKAKTTVDDSSRLKQILSDLRPQFSASEKQLKSDILTLLKDENRLPVAAKGKLNDFCSRSFVQNEDEFIEILKTIEPDIPAECSLLKSDVHQLAELMDLRHNILDPLYKVGTQDTVIGGKDWKK